LTDGQTRDSNFNEPLPIRPGRIQCIKVLSDGKILLGGDIAFYKTTLVNNLIRLKSDYTLDNSFSFSGIKKLLIRNIEIQSTGDIIVLAQGYNSLINCYYSNVSLYQLGPDGNIKKEIDTLSDVSSITIQTDDKVLVGGGTGTNVYLYRFNKDLSADETFNKVSFNNVVSCIEVFANNIFVGGSFTRVGSTTKNNIVKLKPDGTIDNTFDTGSGTNDNIGSLTFQADGKILIGGSYINSYNGIQCHGMIRLNPDGSLDTGFNSPSLNGSTSEITIAGTSIYAAAPLNINSQFNSYLFRLQSDGSMDPGFEPFILDEFGFDDFCMAITQNNLIFNNSKTTGSIYGLSECDSGGNLVKTFGPEVSRYGSVKSGDYFKSKLVIAGDFMKVNGVTTYGLALLNKNGSMDPTFLMNKNLGPVTQLKILNDCSLLVSTGSDFFKVDATGKIKSDFTFQHFKTLYQVIKFKVLDDGKIIAGDPNNIYRLNSNGTEDPTFNIGTGICCSVYTSFDFDIQGDKVIYGSIFNQFNGTDVNRLVRLNPDASVDNTFKTGTGPDDAVTMIKVLDSGEMVIGGSFKNFNGVEVPNRIIKLSRDGAVDSTFIKNQKLSAFFGGIETNFAKVEQEDSMIYVKGVSSIATFNVNGTIYNNFKIPVTVNQINDIVTLKDTTLDVGGKKSLAASTINSCMFAFGSFSDSANNDPSFVVKLILGDNSTPVKVPPYLSVSQSSLNLLSSAGSTATFDIISNSNWNVSSDQPWLNFSTLSGSDSATITLTSWANITPFSRTATLTISGNGVTSQTITIMQPASPLGIKEYVDSYIRIYPIPVIDKLFISVSNPLPQTSISIFSVTGQPVYTSKITNIITEIDLSQYPSGVYFIRIVSKNGETIIKKIIKQ
jgi:uncharacterized delta-60 repeat protein